MPKISIEADTMQNLERLAGEFDITRGKSPSVVGLIRAIADRRLTIQPLETEMPPIAYQIMDWIDCQRPFKLSYADAAGAAKEFEFHYAEIKYLEKRYYLYGWSPDTTDNRDLEPLNHNWGLRLDRIQDASISGLDGALWRTEELATITVKFRLYGNLRFAYVSRPEDVEVIEEGDSKLVIRRIVSSFWFLRSIAPYGADVELLEPVELRGQYHASLVSQLARYTERAVH